MVRRGEPAKTAAVFIPEDAGIEQLRLRAARCTACDIYKRGTQTVFGEGTRSARIVFVGEQPGDQEDLQGRPFVGPVGKLLDRGLNQAGINRPDTYVTNVVKHFKWEPRGKKRIHKKPNAIEINACRPWFEAEIRALKPEVVVCLGATAAQAILGRTFRVTQSRGRILTDTGIAPIIMATVHPSSILRAPDDESRHEAMAEFVRDLQVIGSALARRAA